MESKAKATLLTMLISVINSLLVIVFNLVYNNCVINIYGTEINGLIATLNQFVSLFSVIEGGFTTAAIVATYEPISGNNREKLNSILYTTKKVFLQIGAIITAAVLGVGTIYIYFVESPFSYFYTYALLLISVLTMSSSLCFLSKYSVLLQGTNKEYVQVAISLVARTITWIVSIVLIVNSANVLLVIAINILEVLINVLFVKMYEKRKYPFASYKGEYDKTIIKGTRDVFFQKIANTIFTSTDLVLISLCLNLSFASVYSIYFQVFRAVMSLLTSIVQAPFNSFGLLAAEKNNTKMNEYFDIYQQSVLIVTSVLMTITAVFILPFVRIYTKKVTDFNYVYPSLAILLFIQFFAQVINRPFGVLLNATGNFKMQNMQCILAAIVNLIVSILFIEPLGINSIVIGSIAGTLIILVMNIYQVYRKVLKKNFFRIAVNILSNFALACCLILGSLHIDEMKFGQSYFALIIRGGCFGFICSAIFLLFNLLIDYKRTICAVDYFLRKIRKYAG